MGQGIDPFRKFYLQTTAFISLSVWTTKIALRPHAFSSRGRVRTPLRRKACHIYAAMAMHSYGDFSVDRVVKRPLLPS